ncbi:TonB-dependent receptor [Bacteroides finegoldii]|uniref:TonB-dependent receptor n=2 Tax=Bacteroides finegoldii TaxID=338188 RepID=UPI0001B90EC2|nr:TonB-dependent receptor [Bacteroides finegoldii]EEX43648.1 TonB-linked outer membrane protein, SusC/RagA family [Bacteroides finegoldii DSM 17565]MCG4683121.1 TonB-dependent receptor [Bacteroides finegoldii]MDC7141943.1 TonB-dependent receptor [Bacteroides finegoldii]
MRISLTLLFLVVLQLSAENSYAQRMRIAISMSNVSVEQVLNKIEETSDYVFLYNDETIQKSRIVSVRSKSGKITDILDDIFKGTDISYTVIDKQIILSKSNKVNQTAKAIQIKGTVKDALGEPLIGVSVLVKGTSNGTVTDLDGRFSLNVSVGDILEFSYVGYAAQSVTVKNATPLDIVLSEDAQALDEVVVTALGIKREAKALTYNVQEIKAAGITKVKDANFVNSLSGKIAGVTINQSSSGTGGSSRVVMRGTKSLFGENNALYVLDGIPMQGLRTKQSDNFYESVEVADGDGISNINPEDIESMSVLTGASAAALYGNRGANGVILITTKKGAIGKPRISYSNSTSFSRPFVTPEFQNTYGRKEGEFKSWGDKLEKPSTYNPLDFFQTGFNTMNSIAVSTGTETNQTHISFGAVNSEGIIDNNKYNRYNFTFRNSWDIVKNVLSMDMGLFYIKQNNQNSNGQGMYYNPLVPIYLFPPSDDINKYAVYERYDADRNFKTQYWPYGNQGLGMQNPYWIINRNMFNTDRDRYIISLSMKWNITNWLNIIGRARIDNAYTDFERKLYASTDGLFAKSQGNYMNQEDKNTSTYLDFLVNVDKKFGENYHLLVNLGGSFYDEKYKSDTFEGNLVGVPNFFHPSNIPSTESNYNKSELHTQTQSIYGKAEIGYRNFLYADVTGRIDWFSTLVGTSKEYVCYPSAGLSVILSEILPLPEKIISFWKIRGSYAQVGNPPSAYLPYATVALENGNATSANFTPASHLKPEMTKAFEFGMDLRLFQNKLNIAATYYNSNTYNQLFKYELPPSTGYAFAYENAGKVNNWGIELSVGFNQDLGPVQWNSNLIYSMNRNEIKELLPEYVTDRTTGMTVKSPTEFSVATADSYRMILKKGGSMSDIYATKLKQDLHGNILITNGGVSAEENTFIKVGSAAPKYNLGFRNSFSWKGLELDFLIDARVGGEVISATQALMDQFGVSQQTADARDNKGVVVNKGKLDAEQYYGTVASGKTGLLAHYVYSATNVRLREMSLSYMLPSKWFGEKLNISLSLTGHNLLMFYNKAPFDPELTANTGTYYQGFDYFMPPSLRSFGFGVKVNF